MIPKVKTVSALENFRLAQAATLRAMLEQYSTHISINIYNKQIIIHCENEHFAEAFQSLPDHLRFVIPDSLMDFEIYFEHG
jgi:hypothetical protein